MQCPGQEGAYLEHPPRPDERSRAPGRLAPSAPEHPAHAETDRELRGVKCQDQGCPGHEGNAGESEGWAEGDY